MTTRELFAKHSLRCTRQRMAVYEALLSCDSHPTAEELFRLVKPRTERLSLATIYNTLEALEDVGLVRRMPTTDGGAGTTPTPPRICTCASATAPRSSTSPPI